MPYCSSDCLLPNVLAEIQSFRILRFEVEVQDRDSKSGREKLELLRKGLEEKKDVLPYKMLLRNHLMPPRDMGHGCDPSSMMLAGLSSSFLLSSFDWSENVTAERRGCSVW